MLVTLLACSNIEYTKTTVEPFALYDINPNSNWYETLVSTEDFTTEQTISAWYFGHAT